VDLVFSIAAAEGASDTQRTVKGGNRIDKGENQAYWRPGDTLEHHTKPMLVS